MSKSLPASTSPEAEAPAQPNGKTQTRWRNASPRLALALVLSLAAHALLTEWPVNLEAAAPPLPTLAARLDKMPPPPLPQPPPEAKKPPRKIMTRPAHARAHPAPVVDVPPPLVAEAPQFSPPPPKAIEQPPETIVPAPPPPPSPPPRALPPSHIELVYTVTYGDQGFMVGGSHYRFHHADGRYELQHVTRARGITRLAYRGAFKMESRGSIGNDGLRPDELVVERGSPDKRETARFDWTSGNVTIKDDKTLALAPPTYDVLSLLLQFYFAPPQVGSLHFQVVSTRKLYDFVFERVGEETVTTAMGAIPTQHWKRRPVAGEMDAELWLSPDFNYIPVKIRLAGTERGTAEETLDGIFADPPDEDGKTMP